MLNLTLDTNTIIALEDKRPAAEHVLRLIELHDARQLRLRVVGISASERQKGRRYAENFSEFRTKLEGVGLGHVEILRPPTIISVTYLDWHIVVSGVADELRRIADVLFPGLGASFEEYCTFLGCNHEAGWLDPKLRGTWQNHMVDVAALWSHIFYKGDIFVTSDEDDFLSKRDQLEPLGAGSILSPADAVAAIVALQSR